MIPVVHSILEVRKVLAAARAGGARIAFVPTMGALHAGHAELIRAAGKSAEFVVVSVFVNPTQFGPAEDFNKYPRTLEADAAISAEAGASLVFAPSAVEMYPAGFTTIVEVQKLDSVLCGPRRPGHFRGVCTVVLKLFNIVQPDVALFGAKDAQQSIILKRMVRDLDLPIEMVIAPTVREADGLAMSSRNRYLTPEQRAVAPRISAALSRIRDGAIAGASAVNELEAELRGELGAIPGARIDYAEIRDLESLEEIDALDRPALAAVAVFLGGTRLIDNVVIG